MIYTENIDVETLKETLKVGDVILTEEKCMVVAKIDENGIAVLEPNYQIKRKAVNVCNII